MSAMKPYTAARNPHAASAVAELLAMYPHTRGKALDLGCGNGVKTFPLCNTFETVVGLDASQAMLEDARRNKNGARVKFVKGDFARIPVRNVDVITMWNSLHFSDVATLIPALAHALRPKHVIYVSEPGIASRYAFNDPELIKKKVMIIEKVREQLMRDPRIEVLKYITNDMGYKLVCRVKN